MARKVVTFLIAIGLVALGWVASGIAQATRPDFELIVKAPAGETIIECASGCNLAWVERGRLPNFTPIPTFTFECGGVGATTINRCSSGKVGGWVTR